MNKLLYLQTENEERSEEERGSQTHTTSIMAVLGNAMSTVKSAQCFVGERGTHKHRFDSGSRSSTAALVETLISLKGIRNSLTCFQKNERTKNQVCIVYGKYIKVNGSRYQDNKEFERKHNCFYIFIYFNI